MSYFEKMERLKRKIKQTHSKAGVRHAVDAKRCLSTEAFDSTDGIQPTHPNWQGVRDEHLQRVIKPLAEENRSGVVSLTDYLRALN
mmetsp:Transcript_10593/g.14280  ORF Transcript_10593/g.14280 Transcript_10593/m.14280 type:complete len:86 (+) Transcript_10593:235-492(+)|eukprot:CAMPEP_0185604116 /NCGR_PEP_ID=MMETSP0436-20130131/3043_1 /TAXON_ID=626734 ORGANISM="Favella taraikaensis, Strain Fe Narragansett Bay" /NCGR_SAMPLE_ID=MMETSP0436 /ASSEMBLY_ACC=CAM_ASM_000390 /LENGTH=85 /DNA_ID=CAMNT_0028234851 /DNA_START=1035 /DNA_END=1292 /DNA_ORIENTATION=+